MRICRKCDAEYDTSSSYCPSCHNRYMKAWYKKNPQSTNASAQRRRAKIRRVVQEAKNCPCADCKESYPWYVMDLDHVRGKKLFNLSTAANKMLSIKLVEAEIKKCDVVCANCHRERTFKRSSARGERIELPYAASEGL